MSAPVQNTAPGVVVRCLEDLIAKVQTIAQFSFRSFMVYSEGDLINEAENVKKPCIGVMYEGIEPRDDGIGQGMTSTLRIALVMISDTDSISGNERMSTALEMLDELRQKLRLEKSPTGHPWRFAGERPVGDINNNHVHVQRWTTVAPLTGPNKPHPFA